MQGDIKGTTMPVLEMLLDPGEVIVTVHGDLSWMTPNIQMSQTTSTGGAGGGGFMGTLKRMAGGGSLFLTRYEAQGGQGMVAFASKLPGRIFPVEVAQGKGFLVHRHGWVCGTAGVNATVALQQSIRGAIWGGEGFILQKLEGEGTAWIELSGEVFNYQLVAGQTMLVHPGHVGLFEDTVQFSVIRMQGISNYLFGADGHHLVTMTGPGNIWLQSMPIPVLAGALTPYMAHDEHHDGMRDAVGGGAVGGILGNVLGRGV
jgi:uncharacterized protein (TIGR00266 family)